ncbi:serine hydrolase [Bradyrhizobium sp. 168]|uniref:serine hydrolase domain-containing protein n=1 Tax=Bradyrhizobium sp. 168 TaxID=2782639 RepID=UPI001FF906FA|nr:serine hydrolase [Bradyrhizobium sp. 168]MCK1581847.1 serine hydrolase [Bradyrhizobium sp. 168]
MSDSKFPTSATLSAPCHHLPRAEEFLYLPPWIQPYAYRIVDELFAHRTIRCGPQPRLLPRGEELRLIADGSEFDIGAFMNRNATVGILVIHRGRVVLERYALGLQEHDCWSTMSTIKSMTAMLVGAAIHDGAINSLDEVLTSYVPELKGSAYDGVTLRHLLTMSSGVRWNENYADLTSDVNRYSKSLADRVPGGVLNLMASLARAHPPGTAFLYNSGDTYLPGAALRNAIGMPLADYMSEKIWQPAGMEHDGFYTLESEGGQEIGGSRAGIVLRNFGRFALFVLNDGVIDGRRVLPEAWVDAAAAPAFKVPTPSAVDNTHYGYSWWLGDGFMSALGHAGQRIDIFRKEQLIVVTLGAFPNQPTRRQTITTVVTRSLGLPDWSGQRERLPDNRGRTGRKRQSKPTLQRDAGSSTRPNRSLTGTTVRAPVIC